jgi:hypothetical protein
MKANGKKWNVDGKRVDVLDDKLYINGKLVQTGGGIVTFSLDGGKKKK